MFIEQNRKLQIGLEKLEQAIQHFLVGDIDDKGKRELTKEIEEQLQTNNNFKAQLLESQECLNKAQREQLIQQIKSKQNLYLKRAQKILEIYQKAEHIWEAIEHFDSIRKL